MLVKIVGTLIASDFPIEGPQYNYHCRRGCQEYQKASFIAGWISHQEGGTLYNASRWGINCVHGTPYWKILPEIVHKGRTEKFLKVTFLHWVLSLHVMRSEIGYKIGAFIDVHHWDFVDTCNYMTASKHDQVWSFWNLGWQPYQD